LENSENISSEEPSSDDDGIDSLNESLDSNELNENFAKAMEKQKMEKEKKNKVLPFEAIANDRSIEED